MKSKEFTTESYNPTELEVGDKILKGKFKNSPAEIKGFKTDKNNQPVLKTNKGDVQLFKPRIVKLMKESELVTELYVHDSIDNILKKKGYKFINAGEDQLVFLEPGSKLILKIFGTTRGNTSEKDPQTGTDILTHHQKTFKTFADYCMNNKNNLFLPQFFGWETFQFDNKTYLQIRCERLFPISRHLPIIGRLLADISDCINYNPNLTADKYLEGYYDGYARTHDYDYTGLPQLITQVGEEGFHQLWNTISDLSSIAKTKGYTLDLHDANFMLGSDGQIVISDPFYGGSTF